MELGKISLISLIGVASVSADFADTRTIEHGLRDHPEFLLNSQGLAQHDLSIRGSSYSGAGISINGLNLKAPYSAHFNSELPIIGNLFSVPTIGTGLDAVSGHLIGTAEYTTVPQVSRLQAGAGLGTKEHYQATIVGSTENVGGFLDWEKAREIDYDANDLDRTLGGAHAQLFANEWQVDLIGSHQHKTFGTQGYYGNPAYGEQTVDDSLIFLGATRGDLDDSFIRASSAFRQMDIDDIDSRHGALALEGRTMEIQHIALNLRGDIENEYADGTDRTRSSVLILPEARFERFTLKAGLNTVFQTSESTEFLPIAGIDWFVGDNGRIYFSYTETEQQPDFQTLESNPELQQQLSHNTELGFKHFLSENCDWRIGTFFRTLENANDWIDGSATDLGHLNVAGLDSAISYYPSEQLELKAFYQWIHKDNEQEDGLYETDYPEHMLNLSAFWNFLEEYTVQFSQTTRWQAENDLRTSDDFGAEASLGLHYDPRFANNVRLSLLVDNLWGTDFQSIPGLKPRPTTVFTGLTVQW